MQKSIFPIALVLIVIGVGLVLFNRTNEEPAQVNIDDTGETVDAGLQVSPSSDNSSSNVDNSDSGNVSSGSIEVRLDRNDDDITIYWDATGEEDVTAYEVMRRAEDESEFTVIGFVAVTGSNHGEYHWINSAVADDNSYEYSIRAVK